MFPHDFEHDGEHHVREQPPFSWYMMHMGSRRSSAPQDQEIVPYRELWNRPPLTFDVAYAKELVAAKPRLPSFVEIATFDHDPNVQNYLAREIYKFREDEWAWIRVHVPGLLGYHDGRPLLLDGNHRYAKAKRLGQSHFLAYLLSSEEMVKIRHPDRYTPSEHGI